MKKLIKKIQEYLKERERRSIRKEHENLFVYGSEAFGDDRVAGFEFLVMVQQKEREALAKLN